MIYIKVTQLRRLRWAERVTCAGGKRNALRVLVWKPQGRRPHRRPWRR